MLFAVGIILNPAWPKPSRTCELNRACLLLGFGEALDVCSLPGQGIPHGHCVCAQPPSILQSATLISMQDSCKHSPASLVAIGWQILMIGRMV